MIRRFFNRAHLAAASGLLVLSANGFAQVTPGASVLFNNLAIERPEAGCTTGLAGFREHVHPILRANCSRCHDSQGPGAPHSVADLTESYKRTLVYQNFNNVPGSFFVKKGGNMHCLTVPDIGFNCETDEAMLATAVNAWWNAGEKTCAPAGRFFTAVQQIPVDLPSRAAGFTKMRWHLRSIGSQFDGVWFEIEVQRFAERTEDHPGAYLFRRPRLIATGRTGVRVSSIRLLLNGLNTPQASSFVPVNATVSRAAGENPQDPVWKTPVLSTKSIILIEDKGAADTIAIAFGDLAAATTAVSCKKLPQWQSDVLSVAEARSCFSCHAGGSSEEPGISPARDRFPMTGTADELCQRMLSYAVQGNPTDTPLIEIAVKGALSHPVVFTSPGEALPAWTNWIRSERE